MSRLTSRRFYPDVMYVSLRVSLHILLYTSLPASKCMNATLSSGSDSRKCPGSRELTFRCVFAVYAHLSHRMSSIVSRERNRSSVASKVQDKRISTPSAMLGHDIVR
jgi:hypothetical protein